MTSLIISSSGGDTDYLPGLLFAEQLYHPGNTLERRGKAVAELIATCRRERGEGAGDFEGA